MAQSHFIVVSDLDGTLLDHETYSFDAARPALERLRRARTPLVLCTSKTRAEVEPLRRALESDHPFIVENGGAVVIPRDYFTFDIERAEQRDGASVIPLGNPYADLVAALAQASRETGVAVRGFSDMTTHEVATATGLTLEEARRAKQREFDEPFEIVDVAGTSALRGEIVRAGKRWTAGGRFHHIMGANDKAVAVRLIVDLYRRQFGSVQTVGLGDAMNDVDFLREVDVPVVIRSPQATEIAGLVPGATITRSLGPLGWNEAILDIIS